MNGKEFQAFSKFSSKLMGLKERLSINLISKIYIAVQEKT